MRLDLKKKLTIILMAGTYLGCILSFFILGYLVSRLFTPWAGWPTFILISLLFIVNNSATIPLAKFGRLIVWDFPTNICFSTGTYPIPLYGFLFTLEEFSTSEVPIIFTIDHIPMPDGTEVKVVLMGSLVPDRDNLTVFSEIGGVAGVQANLITRVEPCVKEWFQNADHGPQTWQEAKQTGSAVLPIVMKAILGDEQLPKIPSDIPTPALLRYFTVPRPTQTPAEKTQWGERWEILEALLPADGAELQRLKDSVEKRRKAIASLTNGSASFVDKATGSIFKTLGFDNIEILNGVAEEAVKAAKEAARGDASLIGINESIAQANAIVGALEKIMTITPEQKLRLFREELKKITVDHKLVANGTATMHVIPGLTELAPIIVELLRRRNTP